MDSITSRYIKIFAVLIFCFTFFGCKKNASSSEQKWPILESVVREPVSIIFDTDISGDYDDVGAMGMLHALADRGEVEILGTISSNKSELVAPTIDVINTYYGRPDIPIGVPKGKGVYQDSRELKWPDSLVANFPHDIENNSNAPDAVLVYRSILEEQPDSSVTIVSVGFLTNFKNLLKSPADSISELDGKALVQKKVKKWVAMAGMFPEGKETNVRRDSTASQYAIDNWPTSIVFSGFNIGKNVLTGLRLIKEGNPESPVRVAYAMSIPKRPYDKNGRMSWDQTALLAAARGYEPYYGFRKGRFITSADGSNSWDDDKEGQHSRLTLKMSVDSLAYEIENLMIYDPQKKTNEYEESFSRR